MPQHSPVNLTCLHILFVKEQAKYKWYLQNMQLVSPPMPHCISLAVVDSLLLNSFYSHRYSFFPRKP
jgi:hypothetical protein